MRSYGFSFFSTRCGAVLIAGTALGSVTLLSGGGGSSSTSAAEVRVIDASANAGPLPSL